MQGVWQVLDVSEGVGRWWPTFVDGANETLAETLGRQLREGVTPPLILDGVGHGDGALMIHNLTQNHPLGVLPVLYVVEEDLAHFAVALHLQDWRAAASDDRVVFCLGPEAAERLEEAIRSRPSVAIPRSRISLAGPTPLATQIDATLERLHRERTHRIEAARSRADAVYASRDGAWWHNRFRAALSKRESPLRVLAMTSRYTTVLQYSTRDACRALRELGCEVRLLIEPDASSIIAPEHTLATTAEFQPDLLLLIDHSRRTQPAHTANGLPVLTWIQDRLSWLFDPEAGRAIGALDFCMGLGAEELIRKFHYPRDRFFPCEMATSVSSLEDVGEASESGSNPAVIAFNTPTSSAVRSQPQPKDYTCDVAFATHASEPPADFLKAALAANPDPLVRRAMQAVFDQLAALEKSGVLNGAVDLEYMLAQSCEAEGLTIDALSAERFISTFARPLADRMLRQQTIRWAAGWVERSGRRLNLYGNGWVRHPEFSRYARGPLPHGVELGRAFRAANINLHAGLNTAFHQRVLDGLAAGGFFLVRRHGGDVSLGVSRALHELVVRSGRRAPIVIHAADLPSPLDSKFIRLRQWKGISPDQPLELDQARIDQLVARFEDGESLVPQMLWPDLEEITFETEAEFCELAERYAGDVEARRRIVEKMRGPVVDRFGYRSLLKNVLAWMAERLGESTAAPPGRPQREPVELAASCG